MDIDLEKDEGLLSDFYKYEALYKSEQLTYGDRYAQVVVVTGWSVAKTVAQKLPAWTFAALGQLYNPAGGLSILIRNLLYNPQIRRVVYTNPNPQDLNAQSISSLVAFFEDGVERGISSAERECWKTIGGRGEIEIEIPIEALEALRGRIVLSTLPEYLAGLPARLSDVPTYTRKMTKYEAGNRQVFPIRSIDSNRLPGALVGHRIEAETIAEAFPEIMYRIRTTGRMMTTGYGGYWQELINMTVVINNEPEGFKFEPYLPVDAEYIKSYLPQMCEGLKGQESAVKYTYGSRMREYFGINQVQEIIEKLAKEPDACSAVINLWDSGGIRDDKSSDHQHGGSPCLNHLWFRIENDRLHCVATFRSNDMYSAWVANAMGLRHLQMRIVEALVDEGLDDLVPGTLTTNSLSAHIYEHSFDAADSLMSKRSLKQTYSDNTGNFLVCWDKPNEVCYIGQEYPQGIAAREYRGTDALKLIREVFQSNPAIRGDHAGYLALEIRKCLEQKDAYRQDSKR